MDARIETAIELMHGSKHRNLPISELAKHVNLSPWHFMHLFKAETSVTPKKYLRNLRMKEAETLLQNSFLSVKQITTLVGFNDRSHFSRDFKNVFGENPSDFRTRHKGSSSPKQL
jgi:transcriptional regulator GlxA family with amidase domain